MAAEAGLSVDYRGYVKAMEDAIVRSREGSKKFVVAAITGEFPKTDDSPKYSSQPIEAKVLGWVRDNTVITEGEATAGDQPGACLVPDQHRGLRRS